jgi:hypothetical protein
MAMNVKTEVFWGVMPYTVKTVISGTSGTKGLSDIEVFQLSEYYA